MFNDPESVEYREFILGMIDVTEEKIHQLQETIAKIDQRLATNPDLAGVLNTEKKAVETELQRLEEYLRRLGALPH